MNNLIYVASTKVEYFWPKCSALIESGLMAAEESNIKNVYEDLLRDKALLIVQTNENDEPFWAMVVRFVNTPNIRIAWIVSIGGNGVIERKDEWLDIKNKMKNIGGASKIKAVAKNAQARLWKKMGFVYNSSVIEFNI